MAMAHWSMFSIVPTASLYKQAFDVETKMGLQFWEVFYPPLASSDLPALPDRATGQVLMVLADVPLSDRGVGMAEKPADGQEVQAGQLVLLEPSGSLLCS